MSKARITVVGTLLAVASILVGHSTNAEASLDNKYYAGLHCNAGSSSLQDYPEYWVHQGYVRNTRASALDFSCPAVSDCAAVYSTGHWAIVEHNNTGVSIGCKVCRRDMLTGSASCGDYEYTDDMDTDRQKLDLTAGSTASYTYQGLWVTCNLPAAYGGGGPFIYAYGIAENC